MELQIRSRPSGALAALGQGDRHPSLAVGCQYVVKPRQIGPRIRHSHRQPGQQIQRLKKSLGRSIPVRVFSGQHTQPSLVRARRCSDTGGQDDLPESDPAQRAMRAHGYAAENLNRLRALIVAVEARGPTAGLTALAATLFFWAWWAHYLIYRGHPHRAHARRDSAACRTACRLVGGWVQALAVDDSGGVAGRRKSASVKGFFIQGHSVLRVSRGTCSKNSVEEVFRGSLMSLGQGLQRAGTPTSTADTACLPLRL